ncbi:hypothetical protein [Maridesulfovibrio sp.]|uniref:hypothetical protein n=1 Tax=Maridesulfovibrio sp. TaxID=2795000 RepID=UPI0029CA8608|nr:hypothetical protein [Maridesulfovibrio sp.]
MSSKVTPINETEQSRVLSLVQQQLQANLYPFIILSDVLDFEKFGGVSHLIKTEWEAMEAKNAEFMRDLERRLGNV